MHSNPVCNRFANQINEEIAAGQHHDYVTVNGLKGIEFLPAFKKMHGRDEAAPWNMYDVASRSVAVLGRLRTIYLVALLEAFAKQWVAQRERCSPDDVEDLLKPQWRTWWAANPNESTSLANTKFAMHALGDVYGIDFARVNDQCFFEVNELRNCMVHYGGTLGSERQRLGLQHTLAELGCSTAIGSNVEVPDWLVWRYIEGARAFIAACDV